LLGLAVTRDAVADFLKATQLLDFNVDDLAGMLALVAAHRFGRLHCRKPVEAPLDATAVAGNTPTFTAICLPM